MDIFGVLSFVGGLAMFLYGMSAMGDGLTKLSGGKLEYLLEKLTSKRIMAVLLGAGVTAVIQSSSATTVMVVGFVNSGIMKLNQAVGIIMGANIGTTITSWILSLTGIQGDNVFIKMLNPSSFSPILAIIGVFMLMLAKSDKKKNVGTLLTGFSILMFGMHTMSSAVSPLADVPEFTGLLVKFSMPVLGVLAGTILTAVSDVIRLTATIFTNFVSDPEFLCFCRYSPGTLRNRFRQLRRSDPDHHGTEYRYMYHRIALLHRYKPQCTPYRNGSPLF